jgi:hypothetical protein
MKKIALKISVTLFFTLLLTSCAAYHSGYMASSVSLSSANFSYVKLNVKGKSTATYILGIGGLGKETLVNSAKEQMLSENKLKNNQGLSNLTVNFKNSNILGILSKVTCTVTADIVEFK